MEFVPTESGSYHYATLNPRHFNPFDCDDHFKSLGSSRDANSLANQICSKLEELKQVAARKNNVEDQSSNGPEKRKLTPLYASEQPKKKPKVVEESSCVKGIMERCNECQFDSKYTIHKLYI